MFHDLPEAIQEQMTALEEIDTQDRQDGTPQVKRLRQIPPATGKFLAFIAISAPEGAWLEIGTSAGYSALWLSIAAKQVGVKLITFELLPEKAELARKTFKAAKVGDVVELVHGDARGHVGDYGEVAFCFLDAEREMYSTFYDLVIPNLVTGGLFIADNAISHQDDLQEFLTKAQEDERLDSLILPVGKGLLVCRRI
jgi:predicted O-methyltransferase YrrM